MKAQAISGYVRNCLNMASWGVEVLFFFFISPGSEKGPRYVIKARKKLIFSMKGIAIPWGTVLGWFGPLLYSSFRRAVNRCDFLCVRSSSYFCVTPTLPKCLPCPFAWLIPSK